MAARRKRSVSSTSFGRYEIGPGHEIGIGHDANRGGVGQQPPVGHQQPAVGRAFGKGQVMGDDHDRLPPGLEPAQQSPQAAAKSEILTGRGFV